MKLLDGVRGWAKVSDDGAYRYLLGREWDRTLPPATWVMLNPSTADGREDDQTLRQVQAYSRREGAGAAHVVNLFGLRSSDPALLYRHPDPVGPGNDELLDLFVARPSGITVVAWGAHGHRWPARVQHVLGVAAREGIVLRRLGEPLQSGQPRHPARAGLGHRLEVHW